MASPGLMLLTLPSPAKREFDFKTPHDFAGHRTSSSIPRQLSSPPPERSAPVYLPRKSPAEGSGIGNSESQMSGTPQHSRNLPPPPPLSLPDPRGLQPAGQSSVPQSIQSVLGPLPPPPGPWQGNEDSMRNWLQTKTEEERRRQEEERRKQEEEKSKQELYRLEQRKIEQRMLQESLRAGVPPVWMPMLFVAISSSTSLAGSEFFQNYLTQIISQQPPVQPGASPESARSVPHPPQQPSYRAQASQSTPQTPLGQGPYPQFPGPTSTAPIRSTHAGPAGPGRGQSFEMLPRLATGHAGMPSAPSGHPSSSQPQEVASPIYFHHWTPPTNQAGGTGTGGGNNNNQAPVTPSEYNNSPKKRKTTTSHPAVPPPSSRFSADTGGRRTGHSRQRSDLSMRGGLSSADLPNTRPSSSAADSTPTIPEGQQQQQQQPQPQSQPQQHQLQQQNQQQWHQSQHQSQHQSHQQPPSRPGADAVKAEEHQPSDGGAAGFGSRRSSQPHSSGRASEDVEMSER